jgi:hypothetical protein
VWLDAVCILDQSFSRIESELQSLYIFPCSGFGCDCDLLVGDHLILAVEHCRFFVASLLLMHLLVFANHRSMQKLTFFLPTGDDSFLASWNS